MTLTTAQLDRAVGVLLGTAAGDALVRRRDRLRDIWRTPARICAFLARPATATSEQNKQGDESTSQAEYAGSIPVIGSIKPQLRGLRSLQTLYPRLRFDRPVTVADLKAVCWRLSEI